MHKLTSNRARLSTDRTEIQASRGQIHKFNISGTQSKGLKLTKIAFQVSEGQVKPNTKLALGALFQAL